MISRQHTNRRAHNWLIYNISDRFLLEFSSYYSGHLYDLGCGESTYREFFLRYADKYIGVDWGGSQDKIKADIVADLNSRLPIDSNVADTVVSLSVMEHLSEPQTMLNEAYRILKPSGKIILQVPWQWWIHEAPYDYFRYTPYGLKYMFEKSGFSNIKIIAQSGFFSTWILKINYFTLRAAQGPKIVRWPLKSFLIPFWGIGQYIAPLLDKIDRNWEAESTGFLVTAVKSSIL